jgi:mono/diheme cytochrome c family protein
MKVRAKTIVLGVLGLLVLIVVGGITAIGWQIILGPKMRPVTDRKFEATPERLARGKYIAEGPASCFHCHSEPNFNAPMGEPLASNRGSGWQMPIPELGNPSSANITSDPATGLGSWTDDEIARAIQEGVDKDGRPLFPLMPYLRFREFTDEDLASVVVYVRTIPPVIHAVTPPVWPFPLNVLVKTMPKPLTTHEPAPARATPVARGEYLVKTVAGCGDCHTPSDDKGAPLPGLEFAGGGIFHDPTPGANMKAVFSANITPDPSGISHYDEAYFLQTLHTGQIPGRTLSNIMPFSSFKNLTEDDLKDIFAYIKTLKPVKHRVSNTDSPAKCPVCGQTHGLGDLNSK